MFAFVIYAILVWYLAIRWRRRLIGLIALVSGVAGIVFVGYFHLLLSRWTDGAVFLPLLQILLYPYGMLVAGAGLFMVCLPRRHPASYCKGCGYDLAGLDADVERCPECGSEKLVRAEEPARETEEAARLTELEYYKVDRPDAGGRASAASVPGRGEAGPLSRGAADTEARAAASAAAARR